MKTLFYFLFCLKAIAVDFNTIDLEQCRLTHLGTEYVGKLSKTESNVTCHYWNSVNYKGAELLVDAAFPDGSKILARNYCRNPNKNPKGLWCYTTKQKLIFDTCDVPLCRSPECRVSGPGMEYTGTIQKSSSGKKCSKWKEKHYVVERHREEKFKNNLFADGSADRAGRKCRNPDGNVGGPWCYAERDDSDLHAKELCDIPFCDDLGSVMYSEGSLSRQYFFFSSINESQSFNISVRLWDPGDWLVGEIFILLSAYDVTANSEDIERWSSGVEIMISHQEGSGFLTKDEQLLAKTPLILSAAAWTNLEITWVIVDNSSLLVQLFEKSKPKPLSITEILIKDTIFEIESFRYISLGGSPSLWNLEYDNDECFVHTSSQLNFTRFWLIKRTTLEMSVDFFVRAKRRAVLVLRTAPMVMTNQVQIVLGDKEYVTIVAFIENNQPVQLKEASWPTILDFWKWGFFKITIIVNKLQLFWVRPGSTDLVIEASHPNIEKVMWISFGSPWVSYWTIYCDPRGVADPPPAAPPECITQESEPFNGTMSVTKEGRHCIPWTDTDSIPEKFQLEDLFKPFGGKPACQNFCRNLNNDPKGAFCFVRDKNSDTGYGLEHCHPRSCSLGDCKIAGTANDYIGQLNVTRSKRKCLTWRAIDDKIVNVTNFPDPTLEDAGNYCRNPTKSITGSWCYTNDTKVPRDYCYIKDCDKPLECTVITSGYLDGTDYYILPHWRKYGLQFWLKAWNPDIYEGLKILLSSLDRSQHYSILIGDDDNEKVKLFYKDSKTEIFLVQKTLPHLIPTGKWGGYWLRPGFGKVEIGYSGVPISFFEWISPSKEMSFEPMFLSMGTLQNHWIGVNFHCTECILERISIPQSNKIFPINLWRDEMLTTNVKINLRGIGFANIILMWTPNFEKYLGIRIQPNLGNILILRYSEKQPEETLASFPVAETLSEKTWSTFIISYTENSLTVHKDGDHLLEWPSPFPLLFYWFTVTAGGGTIIWSANCPAADIDGGPKNGNWGKWGPWRCSVTCGKGEGKIERLCNDPPPNVFGKECKGSPVYEGPCNDFPCGEISPGTVNLVRDYLSTQYKSLQVDASERVVLTCNTQAITLITTEVSEMNVTWTHNGFPYSRIKFHMTENYSLVIPHAQEKHNGIYLCIAYQDPDSVPSKVVLEVIALVVIKSKPTKKIRKGRSLPLKCNGMALSYVYADLSQRWEINGTVYKDYGLGTLQTFTVDKVENINESHDGIWTCVIIQEDFRFKWTTNWIYLKVNSAPNFWSNLMEDVATAPLFGRLGNERNTMILFFSLTGTLVGVLIIGTVLFVKWLRN